jgi:hypothetical protein
MQQTMDTCIYAATPCSGLADNMVSTKVVVDKYPYTDSILIPVTNETTKKSIHFRNICIYLLWSLGMETEYILTACAVVCIGRN